MNMVPKMSENNLLALYRDISVICGTISYIESKIGKKERRGIAGEWKLRRIRKTLTT
jgi:hypothetical protein